MALHCPLLASPLNCPTQKVIKKHSIQWGADLHVTYSESKPLFICDVELKKQEPLVNRNKLDITTHLKRRRWEKGCKLKLRCIFEKAADVDQPGGSQVFTRLWQPKCKSGFDLVCWYDAALWISYRWSAMRIWTFWPKMWEFDKLFFLFYFFRKM